MKCLVKLVEYIFSVVNECSPNLCVGPFPRIKMYFFLLSIFVDEVISTQKILTIFPVLPSGCEKNPLPSNSIPYPAYLYLSISVFFVNVTL